MHRTERRAAMRYMEKRHDRGSPCVFISDIVASMKPCNDEILEYGNCSSRRNRKSRCTVNPNRSEIESREHPARDDDRDLSHSSLAILRRSLYCFILLCSEVRNCFSLNFSGILESVATWDATRVCLRAQILSIHRCHRKKSS